MKLRFAPMRLLPPLGFALLAACSPNSGNDSENDVVVNVDRIDSASDPGAIKAPSSPAPATPSAPGSPGGLADDRTPVSEAPFAPDSAQGAADVVQRYYAFLEARDYAQAWALWSDGGKASGMSAEAFAASFAKYGEYHADIGAPGDIDAGAGQRYGTVPVVVYGKLKDGRPFNMKGDVTLHRTEADGATEAQRRWHIRSADIKPRP